MRENESREWKWRSRDIQAYKHYKLKNSNYVYANNNNNNNNIMKNSLVPCTLVPSKLDSIVVTSIIKSIYNT